MPGPAVCTRPDVIVVLPAALSPAVASMTGRHAGAWSRPVRYIFSSAQPTPSFSAAILVPCTRLRIFWKAISRA